MKPVRKWIKISLDIVLFFLLVLMYRKQAVSMSFHEIGGLTLIGLFIVHHVVNGKWITNVTKRLFARETPIKAKFQYALDVLLLIAFLCIGVSGAMISKTVFSFHMNGWGWKTLHYFASAVAVILTGVHIGLHSAYLFGGLRKCAKPVRAAATVLLVVVVAFGVYNVATTSFTRWLAMPFTVQQAGNQHLSNLSEFVVPPEGEIPEMDDAMEFPELPDGEVPEIDDKNASDVAPQNGKGRRDGSGPHGQGNGQGNGQGDGQGNGAKGQGMARKQGGSIVSALTVIAQFGSIAVLFATVTGVVEWLVVKRRRNARRS